MSYRIISYHITLIVIFIGGLRLGLGQQPLDELLDEALDLVEGVAELALNLSYGDLAIL